MRFVRLAQNSPADEANWKAWRRQGITATDAAVIIGKSSFKTPWRLWSEKMGRLPEDDLSFNPYVRRGKTYEHMLREHVASARDIGIIPACIEYDIDPVFRASLDGIDYRGRPWEFKILSSSHFADVKKNGKMSEYFQRYYPQMQHQLLCTESPEGFLCFGDFGTIEETKMDARVREYIVFPVGTDSEFQEMIKAKAYDFLRSLKDGVEPHKDPDRDLFIPSNDQDVAKWQIVAKKILPLLSKKAALEKEVEELKNQISDYGDELKSVLGPNKSGEFAGLRATQYSRKGVVDWHSLLASLGHDANDEAIVGPFRKDGSKAMKFTAL
ncbi:lambda-exonuclease family protein [Paenirhodobacter populi]|uniref:lambda-exonuclease family protein n=1 Tax=Paenirhodobacter populi TaxID=2306993 RepID=UPI0013E30DA7|nr:YqaJ viral recombinase family protein [Sinirhodobacter populi]